MSQSKILLRALPNVEFVHGYPGIPASPNRAQATVRGVVEVRLGNQPVRVKWIKVELRKVETIPSGNGEEFVDFIGQSPLTVWQAQGEEDTISRRDFSFSIRLPETIPPSVALGRGAGIKYSLVATLCMKGKKGLLRREASTTILHAVPVVIDKHELHSTWPVYGQQESRHVTSNGLTLVVNRSNTCFAPSDRLEVRVTLKSDCLSPVVLRGYEFSLKETITYRGAPQAYGKKPPQVQTTTLGEQKVPVSMTLYGGTQHKIDLGCVVPGSHTTSSVNSGRHIDILHNIQVRSILDKANSIFIELPVTLTNWPRHVSADMIKRIGTAPNLSLNQPGEPGISGAGVVQHSDPQANQQLSSRLDLLANSSNDSVPLPAPINGPHASSAPGKTRTPYIPGLRSISNDGIPRSGNTLGRSSSATVEKRGLVDSKKSPPVHPQSLSATEFGKRQKGENAASLTNSYDEGKVIDIGRRSNSLGNPSLGATDSKLTNGDGLRNSYHDTTGSVQSNLSVRATPSRKGRAGSRTLQIVNATEDIPKNDPTPNNTMETIYGENGRLIHGSGHSASSSVTLSITQSSSWPTAEDEKQRMYEHAKIKVEKFQTAKAEMDAAAAQSGSSRSSGAGYASAVEQSASGQSGIVSQSSLDDEPRRAYDQPHNKTRLTDTIGQAKQSSGSNSKSYMSHHRTPSANSSQDLSKRPLVTASPPTMSAGAALYSHAMASVKSPVNTLFNNPNASSSHSPVSPPPSSTGATVSSSVDRYPNAEDEKAVLRYREAQKAVERRQQQYSPPQEEPIAYDALYPPGKSSASPSVPPQSIQPNQNSEKELARRAFQARDAVLAAEQSSLQSQTFTDTSGGMELRAQTPRSHEPWRDGLDHPSGAGMPSDQIPLTSAGSMQTSSTGSDWGGSGSAHSQAKVRGPLTEKEQVKIAFEKRDRTLAAQQALPPSYDDPHPTLPASIIPYSMSNNFVSGHLTAAQEKGILKAQYAEQEARANLGVLPVAPTPSNSSPESSHKRFDPGEVYLMRDPSISAGKRRASQMASPPPPPPPPLPPQSSPPPLLPRPPAEYIEETKREDMKNQLSPTLSRPSRLDIGYHPIGND